MSRRCRECGEGRVKVIGTGYYGDTVEVECNECGASYEVEPDGLGEAGFEWVEGKMKDYENSSEEE